MLEDFTEPISWVNRNIYLMKLCLYRHITGLLYQDMGR